MITHRFTLFDDNWTACFEITVKALNILELEMYSSSYFQKPTVQDFMSFSVLFDLVHETIEETSICSHSESVEWCLWMITVLLWVKTGQTSLPLNALLNLEVFSQASKMTNNRFKHGDVYLQRIQHNHLRCLIGFSTRCIQQTEWCQSLRASLFWVHVGIAS